MHLIVYTSEISVAEPQAETTVEDIVIVAKQRNAANDVTGALFYLNRHFLQAIEAEEAVLRRTFDRIANDRRHKNIVTLVDAPIKSRAFPDWSMDAFFVHSPELFDAKTLQFINDIYDLKFELDTKKLIEFHRTIIEEIDTFNILHFDG